MNEIVEDQKNKVGRPLKFKTVEELEQKVDNYFNTTPKEEWTITGLALHLDTFRKVLCEYETLDDRKEFRNTIKKGKQLVENGYEIDLKKHGRSGTIFALKNFNWSDKSELDLTTKGESINKEAKEKADEAIQEFIGKANSGGE